MYHFNNKASLGVSYQKAYKAGGSALILSTGEPYSWDSEYSNTYEVAFRSEFNNRKTVMNVNVFYTDWDDMQVTKQVGSDNVRTNAGKSNLYGSEFLLSNQFNDQFDAYLSGAYLNTEYTDYVTGNNDYTGNEFIFAPEYMASLGGEYVFGQHWLVSADVAYTSEVFGDSANTDEAKVAGRTLINAKIGYEANHWSVYLYSRNLTDETYVHSYRVSGGNRQQVVPGEPRFVGMMLNIEL